MKFKCLLLGHRWEHQYYLSEKYETYRCIRCGKAIYRQRITIGGK